MSLRHKNHFEYQRDVGARLDAHLQRLRDRPFEQAMQDGFMMFAFTLEDFQSKARRYQELYPKLAMLLFAQHDALRGMLISHVNLAPVSLAASVRIALEARINFTFIASRPFPCYHADLFARYAELERLAHDEKKLVGLPRLTPTERQRLMDLCPEWIRDRPKKDGSLRFKYHWWTADIEDATLRDIAQAVDLGDDYDKVYSVTSVFVHGSPLMKYGFESEKQISPIGIPMKCKQMAFIGFTSSLKCLERACEFFDVPFDPIEYALCQQQILNTSLDAL